MARRFPFALVRPLLLGVLAVVAASYALVRYYTHPRQPMRVPVPAEAAPEAPGELPAPELLPTP